MNLLHRAYNQGANRDHQISASDKGVQAAKSRALIAMAAKVFKAFKTVKSGTSGTSGKAGVAERRLFMWGGLSSSWQIRQSALGKSSESQGRAFV